MAEREREKSNSKTTSVRLDAARSGRPIGDDREAIYREIWKLAETEVETSNRLFEILADWDAQLQALEGIDELLAGDSFEAAGPGASDMDGGPVL
ncbi:MAG: hypothetical protein AAGI89_01960 [Pseudomonadota bacterium]